MSSKKRFKTNKSISTEGEDNQLKLTAERSQKSQQFINWYPGHMNKAIKQIKSKLKLIDIVLEIRDARLPTLSGNPALDEVLSTKNRLIVLNKMELANPKDLIKWKEYFNQKKVDYIFINALDKNSISQILNKTQELVLEKYHAQNPDGTPPSKINLMMIGLPNTGKSTIINRMSGRSAARTADKPGYTQHQQWIKIEERFVLLDTPGIMPPKLIDLNHGLWLAVIHAIPEKIVANEDSACFLVKFLLSQKSEEFKDRYKLSSLEIDFQTCLAEVAQNRGFFIKKGELDYERTYKTILYDLRAGKLGHYCFESP